MNEKIREANEALCGVLSGGGVVAEVIGTGGGCTAISLTHPDREGYVMITDNDASVPLDEEMEFDHGCFVGRYGTEDTVELEIVFVGKDDEKLKFLPTLATLEKLVEHWVQTGTLV